MADYRPSMHTTSMRDNIILDVEDIYSYKCETIENMPLAMAYVPWQQWKTVYDLNKALEIGTIFPELDLPFCGMRGDRV